MAHPILSLIFPCLYLDDHAEDVYTKFKDEVSEHKATPPTSSYRDHPDEKSTTRQSLNTDERKSHEILTRLQHAPADADTRTLRSELHTTVDAESWTESLAQTILEHLETLLRAGVDLGGALKQIVDNVEEKAYEFRRDHPVYATIITLGVLAVTLPWVLEALGFAEVGIVEGSFAARWQSAFAGYVPRGSLFSFFQSLGMRLHWAL